MKLVVFSVRDSAIGAFDVPVFCKSEGELRRRWSDLVNGDSKDNSVAAHPEDYEVFKLGVYDTDTGLFDCGSPVSVITGKQVLLRSN